MVKIKILIVVKIEPFNSKNLFTECRYVFECKSYGNPKKAGFRKYRENLL